MKFFQQLIIASGIFVSRIATFLPANVKPLGAFGYWGGNPFLYFASIVAFDFLVGGLYPGAIFTYLGFAAYPVIGQIAKKTNSQLLLLPIASFTFFLVSNLGVWWHWYPHTTAGLITCFTLALPFYKRTLLGDLVFGYGYFFVKRFLSENKQLPALSPSNLSTQLN